MHEEMREPTPRGRAFWNPSSVRALLDRAGRLGLASQGASATSLGGSDQAGTRSVAGRGVQGQGSQPMNCERGRVAHPDPVR